MWKLLVNFSEFFSALDEDIWDEKPVDLQKFLYHPDYMRLPQLSSIQEEIVELGSNVFREETWSLLYGDKKAREIAAKNKKELLFLLGKGAGKDLLSEIICIRIVYLLLCLKDPATYYGKPQGDNIDIVNVAKNAKQASNVFFSGLKTRIKFCKWFNGKYKPRAGDIEFDKNVRIHSLNSENEGTEGLNILVAVLDELDSFDEGDTTSNADKMYKTLSATVSSRFDENGKVLVLSFPRKKDGFIMTKYNDYVGEKIVTEHKHNFILNPDLPPGTDGNEFSVTWQEDEIVSYKFSNVWALRRPTWKVNPTKSIDNFVMDFYSDMNDALGRFAACPQDTDGINDWYRDKAKIDATFVNDNGVAEDGSIRINPIEGMTYYIHVDLALVQDNAAVAMSHVEKYGQFQIGSSLSDPAPFVITDLVRYWKPGKERALDFTDIREFIISLRRKGFDIRKVTFDRWESNQIISMLNEIGINAEKLSVGRDHYNELALTMGENRLVGPNSTLLIKELKTLIINDKGKVDHPGRTGNDLSDAVCGSVYNAATLTPRPQGDLELITYQDIKESRVKEDLFMNNPGIKPISPPSKHTMPDGLEAYLEGIRLL